MNELFLQKAAYPLEKNIKNPNFGPQGSTIQPVCIFISQQESIPVLHLLEGIFVQFELGKNSLPSYRGLSVSIIYNVAVVMVRPDGVIKSFIFPFTVCSKGSSTVPHELDVAILALSPLSELSRESQLRSVAQNDYLYIDEDDNQLILNPLTDHVIMYDNENICDLSYAQFIYIGAAVTIRLNFVNTTKVFPVVRISLVLSEFRTADKSRVREKVLDKTIKHISQALSVHIRLMPPTNQPTSFSSPLVEVSYHINVEFLPEQSATSIAPVSWKFPVDVRCHPPYRSPVLERVACLETPTFPISQEL